MIPTQSYKEWFHSPVKDSGKDWKNNKTHGEYIQYFYAKLTQIIRENGFNIKNEKNKIFILKKYICPRCFSNIAFVI